MILTSPQVSIKNSSVTELMREYLGASGCSGCDLGMKCFELCALGCCSGLCDSCYYHGTHNFDYEDSNSTEVKNALTVKTVGHDDMAWYAEATYSIPLPLLSYIPLHRRNSTVEAYFLMSSIRTSHRCM